MYYTINIWSFSSRALYIQLGSPFEGFRSAGRRRKRHKASQGGFRTRLVLAPTFCLCTRLPDTNTVVSDYDSRHITSTGGRAGGRHRYVLFPAMMRDYKSRSTRSQSIQQKSMHAAHHLHNLIVDQRVCVDRPELRKCDISKLVARRRDDVENPRIRKAWHDDTYTRYSYYYCMMLYIIILNHTITLLRAQQRVFHIFDSVNFCVRHASVWQLSIRPHRFASPGCSIFFGTISDANQISTTDCINMMFCFLPPAASPPAGPPPHQLGGRGGHRSFAIRPGSLR